MPKSGALLLADGEPHLARLELVCERRGRLRVARLIREHGREMSLIAPRLALTAARPRRAASCHGEPCGAHHPRLPKLRLRP